LNVPDDVEVRKVDLAVELQILAFHEQRRTDEIDQAADREAKLLSTSPDSLGEAIVV
jgi:redox-sensing transcriptional repressor